MVALDNRGYRAVLMHFRGCSGEPNRKRGSYHSGHTIDISLVIDTLAKRYPDTSIAAVGYSLGGNALLKYLATSTENPLCYAVSVSPPLVLAEGARRMNRGLSRIYQWKLVRAMKTAMAAKDKRFPHLQLNNTGYTNTKNFWQFDDQVTAPLHGYKSVADYYERASTLQDLPSIKTATHILFARDDPFFSSACIPTGNDMLGVAVNFEIAERGGHVAFIEGQIPLLGHSWLCSHVCELLRLPLARDKNHDL